MLADAIDGEEEERALNGGQGEDHSLAPNDVSPERPGRQDSPLQ